MYDTGIYAMEQNCDLITFVDDNVCVKQILRTVILIISDCFASTLTNPNLLSATVESANYREKKDQERVGRMICCQPVKFGGPPRVLLPVTDHKDEILRQHKGNPGNIKKIRNKNT
jgi:hypothetical protein